MSYGSAQLQETCGLIQLDMFINGQVQRGVTRFMGKNDREAKEE